MCKKLKQCDEHQRVLITQEEESRTKAQEVDVRSQSKLDSLPNGCNKNVEVIWRTTKPWK